MDGVLFEKWMQNIDKKLTTEESIVLLVDNYQAQLTIDNLNLTEIIFMSVINATLANESGNSLIRFLKAQYKTLTKQILFEAIENGKKSIFGG